MDGSQFLTVVATYQCLSGISWLQSIVNGNCVTLIPVARRNEYLECIVSMQQKDQVREAIFVYMNVSHACIVC